jgi:hypothetical protein
MRDPLLPDHVAVGPRHGRQEAGGVTFGQAIEQYLKAKARKKSIKEDERHLKTLRLAFGADTPLAEITAARIVAWKADRMSAESPVTKRVYAAATINRPLAALRHLLQLAHEEWELLPTVPKIKLEREPQAASAGSSRKTRRGCWRPAADPRTRS